MRAPIILSFLVLTLDIAFLFAPSNPQETYPVVAKIKDGVKTITNPDYPRDGRLTAKLTLEMSCGQEDAPEAALLNKPVDLKVDDQGLVYVMDWGDGHIKVFDGTGRFIRTIGRRGQGPGEFGIPASFDLMSGGRVCIQDGMQRRIMFFSAEGAYISMFAFDGFLRSVSVDGQDRLYLAKWAAVEDPKLSAEFREVPYLTSIFRTDITGKNLIHLADFPGESMIMKSEGNTRVTGSGGLYTIVWNVNRQGRLYGGYNEDYRLAAYGSDGKIEFYFGRLFKRVKNTRFKGPFAQKKTLPVFNQSIVFDDEECLWIELFQNEDNNGVLYDVFSPEGTYLKQVKIKHRISQFKNRKPYSIVFSEDGYPSIKRFRIDLVSEVRKWPDTGQNRNQPALLR